MRLSKLCCPAVFVFPFIFALNAAAAPEIGDPAPDFRLQDQNGDWHQLGDYRGHWLTVYFYPKDDTPGCTTQACSLRDNFYAFKKIHAEVIGISVDDVASHEAFASKYQLPFTILADSDQHTAEAYGVLKDYVVAKMASRQTFIIDPEGKIARHYEKVDPETHTAMVLADLAKLMATTSEAPEV